MQKMIATAIVFCLLGAGWISADLISSSIKTDGSAWISSALIGEKTYATTLFTSDRSAIDREVDFFDTIQAQTRVNSSGPVGVHEFSAQARMNEHPAFACMFADRGSNKTRYDEISTLGLWSAGTYLSSRTIGLRQTGSLTDINGTGMVSLSKGTKSSNLTQRERSFIAGKMNISEAVAYGAEL